MSLLRAPTRDACARAAVSCEALTAEEEDELVEMLVEEAVSALAAPVAATRRSPPPARLAAAIRSKSAPCSPTFVSAAHPILA